MTITKKDLTDLRVGDIVELAGHPQLKGAKLVGPLYETHDFPGRQIVNVKGD